MGYSSGGVLLFRGNFAASSSSASTSAKLKPPLTLWPPLPFGDPPAAANTNGGSSGNGGSHQGDGAAVTVPVVSLLFGERAPSSALQGASNGSSSSGGGRGSSGASSNHRASLPRLFVVTHLLGRGDYGTVRKRSDSPVAAMKTLTLMIDDWSRRFFYSHRVVCSFLLFLSLSPLVF